MLSYIMNKSAACSTVTFSCLDDSLPEPENYEKFFKGFKEEMLSAINYAEKQSNPSDQLNDINRYNYSGCSFDEFAFCAISVYSPNNYGSVFYDEDEDYGAKVWEYIGRSLKDLGFVSHTHTPTYNEKNGTYVDFYVVTIPVLIKSLGYT